MIICKITEHCFIAVGIFQTFLNIFKPGMVPGFIAYLTGQIFGFYIKNIPADININHRFVSRIAKITVLEYILYERKQYQRDKLQVSGFIGAVNFDTSFMALSYPV